MQKVSKQSLAMLALSILLAISIALTFTFASLNQTKTANGTITFSGDVVLQFNDGSGDAYGNGWDGETNSTTFTISNISSAEAIDTALAKVKFKLSDTSLSAYMGVKIEITNPHAGLIFTAQSGYTYSDNKLVWKEVSNVIAPASSEKTLANFIDCTSLDMTQLSYNASTGAIDDVEIVLTVQAGTKTGDITVA